MINKERLINLTKRLISINSENPPGREEEIAKFVKAELVNSGASNVKTFAFQKARPNVVGMIRGKISSKSLLLSPHMDTVPAGKNWKHDPFRAVIRNGRLFGRGASDCKGNLAVCLEVVRSLIEEGTRLQQDIIVAATVDEETGSRQGILKLLERKIIKCGSALILDSNDFKVIIAQKGLIHFKIKIFGKKAHGAYPERGINAIEIASGIICDLKRMKFSFKPHPYLKGPTLNMGKISGGEKANIVADYCELEVDLRFLPGMNAATILKQVKGIIRSRKARFSLEVDSLQAPYEISESHPLVRKILKSDNKFSLSGSEGATVITLFKKYKIPAIATGFGSGGTAHSADEYVRVDNLYRGALALEKFLKEV